MVQSEDVSFADLRNDRRREKTCSPLHSSAESHALCGAGKAALSSAGKLEGFHGTGSSMGSIS